MEFSLIKSSYTICLFFTVFTARAPHDLCTLGLSSCICLLDANCTWITQVANFQCPLTYFYDIKSMDLILTFMILSPWISGFQPFPAQPSFATVFSFHFWKLLNNTSFLPFSWLKHSNFWKANDTHHSLFPSLPHQLPLCLSDHDYNSTSMQPKMLSLTDLFARTLLYTLPSPSLL